MELFLYDLFLAMTALLAALVSLAAYRILPASWLCDYGEIPGEMHLPEQRCRQWKKALAVMWTGGLLLLKTAGRMNLIEGFFLGTAFLILMTASLSDCDYRIIPDQSAAAMLILGMIICLVRPGSSFRCFAAGGGLVLLLMLFSSAAGRILSGQEGIGSGDIKLMTACGACVGASCSSEWASAALVFYSLSILSAGVWFAILLLLRRTRYGEGRPMAPWIAASALLCMAAAPG